MLFVLPATSAVRPASYLAPQPHDYYPSQGYYHCRGVPQFVAPSYPTPQHFFRQPSAEEIEESEYLRALEVVANHRRRRVAEEAAIRRQQQVEAARQRYFAVLAAELEQQRQEELLAARRAEFIRSHQARARSVAAERQHALSAFSRQLGGVQPIARHPHVAKRKTLVDALKQRLAVESDADITESIQNALPSLEPPAARSEQPESPGEDAAKLIENLLSSIFPGLVFHTQPQSTSSTEQEKPSVSDKGKGKARASDVEEPQKPAPKPESAGETFADILRHAMELSKSTPAPRSPNKAGPSGSPSPSAAANPTVTEREQAQIDRAIALSSIEHVQDTLNKLRTDFVLPTELDHYIPFTDDHDETASVLSTSSSDLTRLIPYTRVNKPVYKYENELNGLLEDLDRIDSHGDAEVREKRKEVVKAVEKALEGVEHVVGEAVEKRLTLTSTATLVADKPLEGFDVDEDVTEEEAPAPGLVDTPAVAGEAAVPEPSTSVAVEETPAEPDVGASTATITPASVNLVSVTEAQPIRSQVPADAPDAVDTFLLPERVFPPSPVEKLQEIDSDTDEEVLALDSDVERSDWSEVEH